MLEEVGVDWDPYETAWMRHYEEFKSYLLKNGHYPHGRKSPLSKWVSWQRHMHVARKMPPERKKLLDEIGFVWSVYGNGIPRLSRWQNRGK